MSRRPGRRPELDERDVEALITRRAGRADEHLQQAVDLLVSMASGPAPQPTPALADLLDRGFQPGTAARPVRPPTRTTRRWGARIGAVLVAGVASVLVAGVAQALPAALQNGVAELVSALTPFELPRSTSAGPGPASDDTPEDGPSQPTDTLPGGASDGSTSPAPATAAAPAVEDDEPDDHETGDGGWTAEPPARDTQRAADDTDDTTDDTTENAEESHAAENPADRAEAASDNDG